MQPQVELQRLADLFADLERIKADPSSNHPAMRAELDDLHARLSALEADLKPALFQPAQASAAKPVQSTTQTLAKVSLLDAVAKQASQQIETLRLLEQAEQARVEAEAATRRFIHEGWDSFLDAIHHNERIGYAYDQKTLDPHHAELCEQGGIQTPVSVMEQQVGALYLEPNPQRPLSNGDKNLISGVAERIAQQVENIRLLADAARARAEAEKAVRTLTRESWQSFENENQETAHAFIYDSLKVSPLAADSLPGDIVHSEPLKVRGQVIGQLAVAGTKVPPRAAAIAASIAAQASIHLETIRLAEELQKRAKRLEELDKLKSAFLANMSHELRTPLNSILGFSDVILEGIDGTLTDHMRFDINLIQKNGQHLLALINDVLDMAKIESGRMSLFPETFKASSILEEVLGITATMANDKNLALFIEKDSNPTLEIFADKTRFRQVMINLVNNAIKFTERGQVAVCVCLQNGDTIHVTVRDTGIGIPAEKLEAIFQEFTQLDTSTTRKAGGTGLGLPISRNLVEMHGGRLWAESSGVSGEGSVLHVTLPLEARISIPIEKKER